LADPNPENDASFEQWLTDLNAKQPSAMVREGQLLRAALLDTHRELPPESTPADVAARAAALIRSLDDQGLFTREPRPSSRRLLEWLFPPLAPPLLEMRTGGPSRSWRRWIPFITLLALLTAAIVWLVRR